MVEYKLDELDRQIIDELRRDGRLANTEIARRLGVSEATVRTRIQRLISENIIQIAAFVNLDRLGYQTTVVIGIHCDPGRVLEVADALMSMTEVRTVSHVTGSYDLLISAFFPSQADLFEFLTRRLGTIAGIQRIETFHVLKVFERDFDTMRGLNAVHG